MGEKSYRLIKEIIGAYNIKDYGILYNCKMFKVFDQSTRLGQFFYNDKVCFLGFEDYDLRIKIEMHIFKKTDYILVNNKTEESIGHYRLPNWTSGGLGKIGELICGDAIYECKILLPDIRYSMIKSSTWGNYKFSLSNDTSTLIYKFKTDRNSRDLQHSHLYSFEGSTDLANTNLLTLFAGLYLIEAGLKQQYL